MSWREVTSFGRTEFEFPTTFAEYTVATAPAATLPELKYTYITITDGGAGSTPIIAMSNGTNWVAFHDHETVIIGSVVSLAVSPTTGTIAPAETLQLTATVVTTANASKAVTWTSSDETKATVSATGLVTGVADGPATITATADFDGTTHAHATITVTT